MSFVGREYEQQMYRDFLTHESPWVFIINGLSGSGKSSLLNKLKEHTTNVFSQIDEHTVQRMVVVKIDFATYGQQADYLSILREFTRQIEVSCKLTRSSKFKKILDDGRNAIKLYSAQAKQDIIRQEITVHSGEVKGAELRIKLDKAIQEVKYQVMEEVIEPFYAQLDAFNVTCLVLMLDTCEWLNDTEIGQWVLNEFLPGLRTRMAEQMRKLFVVASGRTLHKLEAIDRQDQKFIRLSVLSRAEVDQYLSQLGISDPDTCAYIYDMTCGHADCLSIFKMLCDEQQKEPPSKVADVLALHEKFIERVRQTVIDEDILNPRFIIFPYRELTQYGVLLRSFNQSLLKTVFPEWLPDTMAREHFDRFVRYPHIMPPQGDYYTFFTLLREILADRVFGQEPEKWRQYHQIALQYFADVAPNSANWYYHDIAYKLANKETFKQVKDMLQKAKANTNPTPSDRILLEVANDKTLLSLLEQNSLDGYIGSVKEGAY